MEARAFGNTGLTVTALGLGGGQVGSDNLSEDDAVRLLNGVLDAGINFIDTARGYGRSEERIGRHLASRRDEFVLSSKCGYGIPGKEDWTADCVTAGVDEALRLLQTDRIDIMHLHSCPKETLERGEVIGALERAVQAGKVRVAAYSGENEALEYAVSTGRFGSLQTSVNFCDQRGIDRYIAPAAGRGMGVIGKRPLANGPWKYAERPNGEYVEIYWDRFRDMGFEAGGIHGLPWDEVALRFAAFAPGVTTIISGTANLEHLRHNVEIVNRGPLPGELVDALRLAFQQHDRDWVGQV